MREGKCIRRTSLLTAVIEQYLFSGLMLGWASMVYIMKEEKFFAELCENQNSTLNASTSTVDQCIDLEKTLGCPEQDAQFNKIFVVAVTTYELASAFLGWIFDRIGTGYTRILITIMETIGLILIGSAKPASSWILYPGTLLIAVAGIMVLITNMQLANLFVNTRSTVLTLLNGVYDSSSCTFMVMKILYDLGISYQQLFMVLTVLTVIPWCRTFFLMPKVSIPWPLPKNFEFGIKSWCKSDESEIFDMGNLSGSEEEVHDLKTKIPLKDSLKSMSFISMNIWFVVVNLRHVFFISSANSWLTGLSKATHDSCEIDNCCEIEQKEHDFVSEWTNIFGIFQFFGIAFAPMAGGIIDILNRRFTRNGYLQKDAECTSCGVSLIITSVLGIAFSIMSANAHSSPNTSVIGATLLLEVAFRAFLYGSHANFISVLYPSYSFGSLYGISMFIGGVTGFASIPLFDVAVGPLNSQFYFLDWFFVILIACGTIWPALVNVTCFNY